MICAEYFIVKSLRPYRDGTKKLPFSPRGHLVMRKPWQVKLLEPQQEAKQWPQTGEVATVSCRDTYSQRQKMPASFKGVLGEIVQMINFAESQPSSTRLLTFCVMRSAVYLECLAGPTWLAVGNCTCELIWVGGKPASWSTEHHFYLKEQPTDKLWAFRLCYLAGSFSKGRRKSWPHLLSMNLSCEAEVRILEDLYLPPWTWQLANI